MRLKKSSEVLYLFNSGLSNLYIKNVFRTLALPSGCHNEYRYRIDQNVYISILEKAKKGTPVRIIFIDRYANPDYLYIPLRSGTLVCAKRKNDQIFFKVKLGHILNEPDCNNFKSKFIDPTKSIELPSKQPDGSENVRDGQYAFFYKDLFNSSISGAWSDTVDELSKTKVFENGDIFYKLEVLNNESQSIPPDNSGKYNFKFGSEYQLEIAYRTSVYNHDIKIPLESRGCVHVSGDDYFCVDSRSNSQVVQLIPQRKVSPKNGEVLLAAKCLNKFEYNINIEYELSETKAIYVLAGIAILAYVVCGCFSPSDWWWKGILGLIQLGATIFLFVLYGHKIF